MSIVSIIEQVISEQCSLDEVLSNKETVLTIFQSFNEISDQHLDQILFVLLSKIETNAHCFSSEEFLFIFSRIASNTRILHNPQFSYLISNFVHFLSLCSYIPIESCIEFSNNIHSSAFRLTESGIEILNPQLLSLSLNLMTATIQVLSMNSHLDIIESYKEASIKLLNTPDPQNPENCIILVCDLIVEIIENGKNCFDLDFFQLMINNIKESENLFAWNKVWANLTYIDEDNIKQILDFSVSSLLEVVGSEYMSALFGFLANNSQFIEFSRYVSDEVSLLTLFLQFNASIESLEEYDDFLFCKLVKYSSYCESEFTVLLEFIGESVSCDSLSDVQVVMLLSAFSVMLEEKGYSFLFVISSSGLQTQLFEFINSNKEELFDNSDITQSINSLFLCFLSYKEYVDKQTTTEIFEFLFSNLSEIEDESHFILIYNLLVNIVPFVNISFEDLVAATNEQNVDILTQYINVNDNKFFSLEIINELLSNFLPLIETNTELILPVYSLIASVYSQKHFIEHICGTFNELTQTILSSLSDQEPNFVSSFLKTLVCALCASKSLPEYDFSCLDQFEEHSSVEVFQPVINEIRRIKFLYSETTQKFVMFKETPLLFTDLLIAFPSMYTPAFFINCELIWLNVSFLSERKKMEEIGRFLKAMVECDPVLIQRIFTFFVKLPLNSDGDTLRCVLVLLPLLMSSESINKTHLQMFHDYISEKNLLFAPFAVNNGVLFDVSLTDELFSFSIVNCGALLALISSNGEPKEIPSQEFLNFIVENVDSDKGFEVFVLDLFNHNPNAFEADLIVRIIKKFPQNMFATQMLMQIVSILRNQNIEQQIRLETCIVLMNCLLLSDLALLKRNITKARIIEVIKQTEEEIVEAALSQFGDLSDYISSLLT